MPFDPKSARNAGKKSKRAPAKKAESTIKHKMELLYEEILYELLVNQKSYTKTKCLSGFPRIDLGKVHRETCCENFGNDYHICFRSF
jgi:hypothetical protein